MYQKSDINNNYLQCHHLREEIMKHSVFNEESKRFVSYYFNFIRPIGFLKYFTYSCIDHFDNKKDAFLYFYNNDIDFRLFVNEKSISTMWFLSDTPELYEFINIFITEDNIKWAITSWRQYFDECMQLGYKLSYTFCNQFRYKIYDSSSYSYAKANNYVVCLEELQKHENIDELITMYINDNVNNRFCDFNCLLNILPDDKKDYWKNYIFLQKLKSKVKH